MSANLYVDVALPVAGRSGDSIFTYAVGPAILPSIALGQRVYAPFRRQMLVGVIVGITPKAPRIRGAIREIDSLVDNRPLFRAVDLKYAEAMAKRYLVPLGEILALSAPSPAKRLIKRTIDQSNIESEAFRPSRNSHYGLYLPTAERYNSYGSIISQAGKRGGRVLIVLPTQSQVEWLAERLSRQQTPSVCLPTAGDLTDYYAACYQAIFGNEKVIIGTRKAILLPIRQLTTIIIDEPGHFSYKEEQSPYYTVSTAARLKSEIYSGVLIFSDAVPGLAEWQELNASKLRLIKPSSNADNLKRSVTILDRTSERGLIAEPVRERIEHLLQAGGRVGIYFNKRGSGRMLVCRECENSFYCPRCDNLLTYFNEPTPDRLVCTSCHHQQSPPLNCPVCQTYQLSSRGIGIDSLAAVYRQVFPEARVATVDSQPADFAAVDILIGTNQLFNLPPDVNFDLLVGYTIDQLLHGTSWQRDESAFILLSRLKGRANEFVIQSSQPDHPVLQAIAANDYYSLYVTELVARQSSGYPPAQQITVFRGSDTNEHRLKEVADKLFADLSRELGLDSDHIFPPSPIGTGKRRDRFRLQILIKEPATRAMKSLLPKGWQLDAEPVDL